ncbi:MAG: hypothetical protein ACRC1W_01505, partial [Shewanella sp.]
MMNHEENCVTIAPVAGGRAVEFDLDDYTDGDELMEAVMREVMANSVNPDGDWMVVDTDGFVTKWMEFGG